MKMSETTVHYSFCESTEQKGSIRVKKADRYDSSHSWGFLTEENRAEEKRLQIPEINSGYDTVYWFRGMQITEIEEDTYGCCAKSEYGSGIPCTFQCDVAGEGNYRVTVKLYAAQELSEGFVFLGRRRLAVRRAFQKGEYYTGSFVTNICPIIPRNHSEQMEDTSLDVTVIGEGLHLAELAIEQADCKTIYIAGDSTVTDQNTEYPYVPGASYCGWGQMLSAYVGEEMAVSNHSHSGLTTESFRSEGHYGILLERIRTGDYCLIQFAHNDQKLAHLKAREGYRENLVRYIEELREKGAVPVLVTPLARNTWKGNDGSYNDLLAEYEEVCREVGSSYQVPVIELHEESMRFVKEHGKDDAKRYFFPSDYTHSNDYGAYYFAGIVCQGLKDAGLLTESVLQPEWIPPEKILVPEPPEEFKDMVNPNAEELFADLERPEDELTRTEALEFIITSMHFFPTNVYNDMFTDVIGHETFAGTVECGCQNGIIPAYVMESGDFRPYDKITGKEFFEFLSNGYSSRKSDILEISEILPEGLSEQKTISRRAAADICRRLHI